MELILLLMSIRLNVLKILLFLRHFFSSNCFLIILFKDFLELCFFWNSSAGNNRIGLIKNIWKMRHFSHSLKLVN